MYKVIRKKDAIHRKVTENINAFNLVTSNISPNVSLAILKAKNTKEDKKPIYNRIYYVLSGKLTLTFGNKKHLLTKGDACYITKGTDYILQGTFECVIINQPAFGTLKAKNLKSA